MESLLEELWRPPVVRDRAYLAAGAERRHNTARLRESLTKPQRRQLLRILDADDLRAEAESQKSFADGVRFGVRLMIAAFGLR